MPSYIVDVPEKGRFRVESPTELTDEQAYDAAIKLAPPEPTIGGYAKEAFKAIPRGAAGFLESAATGAEIGRAHV